MADLRINDNDSPIFKETPFVEVSTMTILQITSSCKKFWFSNISEIAELTRIDQFGVFYLRI